MPQTPSKLVATLIAADRFDAGAMEEVADRLRASGAVPETPVWLDEGKAFDILLTGRADSARDALAFYSDTADIVVQGTEHRRKMLLVSDMDSTIITIECIDELADYAGIKAEIAEITERAMQGELDFEGALRARVKLLKGLHRSAIDRCISERLKLTPGAETLLATMRDWGARSLLVSGGFTDFVSWVAKRIGFDGIAANQLGFENENLTGEVEGAIVDAAEKARQLEATRAHLGLHPAQVLAAGDGANDIPMVVAAISGGGLGVAYHAKPALAGRANFSIRHNDLSAILFAQGVPKSEWKLSQ